MTSDRKPLFEHLVIGTAYQNAECWSVPRRKPQAPFRVGAVVIEHLLEAVSTLGRAACAAPRGSCNQRAGPSGFSTSAHLLEKYTTHDWP